MDNRLKVAIAVSQNYYTILDRRKRYARHIDTLNEMKPDIEMTEIPMAPRLVAYRKKSEDYRKSQKKLDDECIAMLRKTYKEREMARRHQKRPTSTRDWVAELGRVRTGKKPTPTNTFASNQPQLRPLQSQRSYKTPAAAKIIFPDNNEQITASELYEPTGLEDGMQVTDQGPASARSPRGNNYVSFGQYPITPPSNQPKSARSNYRTSGTVKEPMNDSSSRSKRKVIVSQTQTEPESQEYESDYLAENDGQPAQNKISTLGDTFQSINSSLVNTTKKDSESEKESFDNTDKENESENEKEKSEKENENESEKETKESENNESEKEGSKKSDEDDDEKENKSENNESGKEEKESDEMNSDFESTAKSDLNSTAKSDLNSTTKSDMNSTMKSDFDDDDDEDKSEDKKDDDDDDEDKSEDKKDDDDDDDEDKKDDDDDDDEDKSEDKKDDDDDEDEDKSEDKKDDDDDEEKESDPFAD